MGAKKKVVKRLAIVEDMTIYNAARQKDELIAVLRASDTLELDLSAVAEIDTSGFQLLVLVKREAERSGKQATIVAHSAPVCEVVDFFNMAARFGDPMLIPAPDRK